MHFRKRAKEFKRLEILCFHQMIGKKPEIPLTDFHITFERFTIRPLDVDNLVASFKPILDSLVKAGVIEDDKWSGTDNIKYRQSKVSKKADQRISIEVLHDAKLAKELH